ncbi:MAG: FAD-dependent monooxygenase [Hyphomicrobium sp.]|nr:FAD-dependent monooxygenase [Hyphomicrobium sp.]
MTSANLNIAIAGAGIGGLSTALALARHGMTASVFEQRSDTKEAGAGIQLGPNATGVLARFGVLDAVRAVASEPDALSIHDAQTGRILARFPLGAWIRERHGAPYLTLHRQDLHRVLSVAVEAEARISLQRGRQVTGFSNNEASVDVRFDIGANERADALIAADGLWSKLRAEVAGRYALVAAGRNAYRTVVAGRALPSNLEANDVHVWLSPGAHIVHYPVRSGAETAIIVVTDGSTSNDGWDSPASGATTQFSVLKFAALLGDLISAADDWRMWRLHMLPPQFPWVKGAVALLGDAAHPLTPFFAQGGALAIEDAAIIAAALARGGAISERLAEYETARRRRVQKVFDASLTNGRIYHLSGAAAVARNAVLACVPGTVMMRRYDWLYGWTPETASSGIARS